MKNLLVLCVLFLASHAFGQNSRTTNTEDVKVVIELAIPKKDETVMYVYYGNIKRSVYNQIQAGEFDGSLLALENVHYVNENDQFVKYEDAEDVGTIVFQPKHLVLMIEKKKFP